MSRASYQQTNDAEDIKDDWLRKEKRKEKRESNYGWPLFTWKKKGGFLLELQDQ